MIKLLKHGQQKYSKLALLLFLITILVTILVVFRPTFSSYGVVINSITGKNIELYVGSPSQIRSDEYSVLTPLMQTTVLGKGESTNQFSIYGENLRSVFSMPILDWAFVFKPYYWLIYLNNSIGLSFYYLFFLLSGLTGFYILGKNLGLNNITATIFSLTLIFNPLVQYIWTTHGQTFAIFPWLLNIIFLNIKDKYKILIGIYLSSVLIIVDFYPPYILQYIYTTILIFFTIKQKKEILSRNILYILGILIGSMIAIFYLWEPINSLSNMPYPGKINANGGGEPISRVLSQFYPYLNYKNKDALYGLNPVEIGSIGALLNLFVLINIQKLKIGKDLYPFLTGLLIITIWQLVPIPGDWVSVVGLNKLYPSRSFMISGFLLTYLSLRIISDNYENITKEYFRNLLYILLIFIVFKLYLYNLNSLASYDYAIILITIVVISYGSVLTKISLLAIVTILLSAMINPIQGARAIFNLRNLEITKEYISATKFNGIVVDTIQMGGIISGLGEKSISHVLLNPNLAYFKNAYPDVLEKDFDTLFNKWLHIKVDLNSTKPNYIFLDATSLPVKDVFAKNITIRERKYINSFSNDIGRFRRIENSNCYDGWYFLDGKEIQEDINFYLYDQANVEIFKNNINNLKIVQRWDVVKAMKNNYLMFNGFYFCSESIVNSIIVSNNNITTILRK
jgi:hypothetical protein